MIVDTDFRPIAITCPISKVAEMFISDLFNMHFDTFIDDDQFGCVPGRSTTLALVKLTHLLFVNSDNCKNIIRLVFLDFKKAFELIDHNILTRYLLQYNFPPHLIMWTLSLLHNRQQFVKIGDTVSSVMHIDAGAPQGTRAGPDVFKVLINDLNLSLPYVKYVDDVSAMSVSTDPNDDSLQQAVNDTYAWSLEHGMVLNATKSKEMCVVFTKAIDKQFITPININNEIVERVASFKLLGVIIRCDLSWQEHVDYIITKASKRFYVLCQLKRSGVCNLDIIAVYCSLIRSIVEYASPVWHSGLTKNQSDLIEGVQKRCLRIIYPDLSYSVAIQLAGLELLSVRREAACRNLFSEIKKPGHILNKLLPLSDVKNVRTRDNYPYKTPISKTDRIKKSLLVYAISKRW